MSCMPAIPLTIVQKTTGAIIIFTSFMNASPSGFNLVAKAGKKKPRAIPIRMAIITWTYKLLRILGMGYRKSYIIEKYIIAIIMASFDSEMMKK
jgi:hypothetical protein